MARPRTLYGPDGRPVERGLLLREQAPPSLASVRQPWMLDAVAENLTPASLAAAIRAADQGETRDFYTLALEMEERMVRYGAVLGVRRRAVLDVDPTVESVSDSAADTALADEIRDLAAAPQFRRLVSECLWALGPGLSGLEIDWDRSARQWRPKGYAWRDPRWFRWDRADAHRLRVLSDEDQSEGAPLVPYGWIVHVPSLRPGIPARGGLARPVSALFCLASWFLAGWAAWLERYGTPARLARYGAGASEDDRRTLERAASLIGSDAVATIPESMSIEFLEAGGRAGTTDAYERAVRWLDEQTAIAVLGQAATTQGTPGRLGSDKAQAEVREDILKGDCEELAATLQRDLVIPYIELNHGPQEAYPRLVLRPEDAEDAESLANTLGKLVPMGLRVESSVVRDRLGLPDPPEGAEVLESANPAPSRPVPAAARALAAALEGRGSESALEEIEARADDGWEPDIEPILAPVRALASRASSYEEFMEGLAGTLGRMGDRRFVERLASLCLMARGLGDARDEP